MADESDTKVYDFKTFIDEFPLPQVVKVIEGVYGNEDELTLSALEVIHLHLIKNYETVKATDERNREFYLPLNSPAKVKVLPHPSYQEFYVNVRKLAEDFPTFVKSCSDYTELNIEMGDVLKLKEVISNPFNEDCLKCECTNKKKKDILIPFSYQVIFNTLGDVEHSVLFLKEVVATAPRFPVLVKFQDSVLKTRRRDVNGGCPTGFNQLGTLTLKEEFVMKLVVATSCSADHGSGRTLLTIPRELDIKVAPVLDESERRAYPTGRHSQIVNFKIDFNETSFRYGCNVVENQGHVLSKQGDCWNTIPDAGDRVTPPVTPSVTSTSSSHIYVNVGSCPSDEMEDGVTSDDIAERKIGGNAYVDMNFCKDVLSGVNRDSKSLMSRQESKNVEDIAAASDDDDGDDEGEGDGKDEGEVDDDENVAAASAAADENNDDDDDDEGEGKDDDDDDDDEGEGKDDDDDDDEGEGEGKDEDDEDVAAADVYDDDGDGGVRDSVGGSGEDSNTDKHFATRRHIPPSDLNFPPDIHDGTHYCIPVISRRSFIPTKQVESPPGSILQSPGDDTEDDVFQGGNGHLGLPPLLPQKPNRQKARSVSFDKEEEDNDEQYVSMAGRVGPVDPEGRPRDTVRRHLSESGPSRTSISSDSSSASSPHYDIPPSPYQTKSKKSKSKLRRKLEKLTKFSRDNLKRPKSTPDLSDTDYYHYVQSIPEAQADKQTDIGKYLSFLQKSKKQKKGGKDLSPVDYLSTLTVDEVGESLKSLNLHRYVESFRANTVDGSLLLDLNDKMLDELEVTSELDRLKIRKLQKEGWTPKYC